MNWEGWDINMAKPSEKIYKIEYGYAHAPGTGQKGINYWISKTLTKTQTEKMLKKLYKKYEYLSVWKYYGNGKWDVIQ